MMKEVRGVYKDHFNEDGKAKLENVGGTLHKCLKEVREFSYYLAT